ncbi:hypothetical protein D9M71_593090 [compost metagenome]
MAVRIEQAEPLEVHPAVCGVPGQFDPGQVHEVQPLVDGIDLAAEGRQLAGAGMDEPRLAAHSGHVEHAVIGEHRRPAVSVAGIPAPGVFRLEVHDRQSGFGIRQPGFQ